MPVSRVVPFPKHKTPAFLEGTRELAELLNAEPPCDAPFDGACRYTKLPRHRWCQTCDEYQAKLDEATK